MLACLLIVNAVVEAVVSAVNRFAISFVSGGLFVSFKCRR